MDSSGSTSFSSSPSNARLTSIMNHLSSRHKVVVCRDLGPEVMPIFLGRKELDVRRELNDMIGDTLTCFQSGHCLA